MSSVNASERNQQTDELRRMREEYDKQEAESTKRKNKELRAMNEKHEQELQANQESYEKQLELIRNKHREIINERDEKHANDSRKLREMYVESLARKTTEGDRLKQEMKETFKSEVEKERQVAAQQRQSLERDFRDSLRERDRQVADGEGRSIEKMKEGLQQRTEKLGEKHKIEMKALVSDRDRQIGQLRNTVDEMKSEFNDQKATDRRLQRSELDRRDAALETIVHNMDRSNSEMIRNRDEQLQNARKEMQNDFQGKMKAEHERMNDLTKQYGDQLESRTFSAIKSAKAEVARVKNDQVLDMITNRRLRDLERKNVQETYQQRFESLEKEKDQIFDVTNAKARDRVEKVIDRTDKLMAENNRRNRMSQNISNMRSREALATNERLHEDQVQTMNNQMDKRVRRIMNDTMSAQKTQIRQHEENLDILKGNYSDNLQNQREAQLETMKNVYDRMDKKIRDQESKLTKKHEEAIEFYEAKIDELEEKKRKDLLKQAETFESRNKQQQKAVNQAMESMELKHKQNVATQEELHRKEIERLEKRHQEQMQTVVARSAAAQLNTRKS